MAERITGRGVYFLPGEHRNRLALDDDHSEVTVDGYHIHVRNTHAYPKKTLAGDLLLLGTGTTEEGKKTRLAFHTRFDKSGARFIAHAHLHPSETGRIVAATCDPYELVLDDGARNRRIVDAEAIAHAWRSPPISSRLGRALITVRDIASDATIDTEVCIGVGPLRRAVARVQTVRQDDFQELRVTALMRLPSAKEHIMRALFLLGLADLPALARVAEDGLARGEALVFRLGKHETWVQVGERRDLVESGETVARDYLDLDFVGAIIASQMSARLKGPLIL